MEIMLNLILSGGLHALKTQLTFKLIITVVKFTEQMKRLWIRLPPSIILTSYNELYALIMHT